MDPREWLIHNEGIAHRSEILEAGCRLTDLRALMRSADVTVIRRAWITLPSAPADLRTAAMAGGQVACVSLARRRGWWMPEGADARTHLRLRPKAGSARMPSPWDGVLHWTTGIAPAPVRSLEESPEDALAHIAQCLPEPLAIVVWESALRAENLSVDVVRSVRWPTPAAAHCAAQVSGLSDSGLETLLVSTLRRWGVAVRQQIVLAGRPVDLLIGDRLVVQVDGWRFHSTSAQRTKDIAHDAELRLRGYTVLRFSYSQVIHDRPAVTQTLRRAIAARLHLAS